MSLEGIKHFDRSDGRHKEELEEVDNGANHNENLFDQNEDTAGETTDLATGKPIDNSTYTAVEGVAMNIVPDTKILDENPETVGIDPNDDAAKWLAENS